MGLCFVCDEELKGDDYVRLSTTRTPYGKTLFPEKIAEVLGEDIVVIVNNDDHACEKCATQLNQIDKLEIDLKLVKNAMLSHIRKKHGILVTDEDVEAVKMEMCDEPAKVSNPLKPSEPHKILINQVKKPIKFLNIQHKLQQTPTQHQVLRPQPVPRPQHVPKPQRVSMPQRVPRPQQVPRPQRVPRPQPPKKQLRVMMPQQVSRRMHEQNLQLPQQKQIQKQQDDANRLEIHNSDTWVQNHIPTNSNKIETGKPIINQDAVKILTPALKQKKPLFICQFCAKDFDNRGHCITHIQKYHKKPTLNKLERKILYSNPGTRNILKLIPKSKFRANNQKVDYPMGDNQVDNKKGTVNINTLLNYNVLVKKSGDTDQEDKIKGEVGETENS